MSGCKEPTFQSVCKIVLLAGVGLLLACLIKGESATAAEQLWFTDSFEGVPPYGWADYWSLGWDEETVVNTQAEGVGSPPGGGAQAFRQWWNGSSDWGGWSSAGGLALDFGAIPDMPNEFKDGDAFYLSYWVYFDENFDWGDTTGFKQIIVRTTDNEQGRVLNEIYIGTYRAAGLLGFSFQHTTDTSVLYSNVPSQAERYRMPKGEWVKFEWYVKVSPQIIPDPSNPGNWLPNSNINGIVKGWVNGELRWDYSDIATIRSGKYTVLNINPTFNPGPNGMPRPPDGPHQKRYWDLFTMGPERPELDSAAPAPPVNLRRRP